MAIEQFGFGPLPFCSGPLAPHKTNTQNLGNLSNVLYVILHKPKCCVFCGQKLTKVRRFNVSSEILQGRCAEPLYWAVMIIYNQTPRQILLWKLRFRLCSPARLLFLNIRYDHVRQISTSYLFIEVVDSQPVCAVFVS